MRSRTILAVLLVSIPALASAQTAPVTTRTIEFRFTPTARTQLALWIEDASGKLVKTVRLTQAVSYRGIGNRPGAAQMNSGFRWPYGRREGVLPIWAHRRVASGGKVFQRVIFQDRQSEGFASRTSADSSSDSYFCLSFTQADTPEQRRQESLDAVTCASGFMSDKGRFITGNDTGYAEPAEIGGEGIMRMLNGTSLYPPRRDVKPCSAPDCAVDTADAPQFDRHAREIMPEIDAVTMATPPPDVEQSILFTVPDDWSDGKYVAWIEVNTEGDYNSAFNDATLPTPTKPQNAWDTWAIQSGYAYRGQPSVVFQAPFELGSTNSAGVVKPTFYGDVDGFGPSGGAMHPVDGRISDDPLAAPGRGADRLRLTRDYRFHVAVRGTELCEQHRPPGRPENVNVAPVEDKKHSHQWGQLGFVVPASDVPIVHYEVRFSTAPISESDPSTFERALPALAASLDSEALMVPTSGKAGTNLMVSFGGMEPLTPYFIAIRAVDMCNVAGPYVVREVTTTRINFTQLSGCFIATAAYGAALEPRVAALRQARDSLRDRSALFTLAADLYYQAGPAAAAVIAKSDVTRAVVRTLLGPVARLAEAVYPAASPQVSPALSPRPSSSPSEAEDSGYPSTRAGSATFSR